jgi:copper homeostasis protein
MLLEVIVQSVADAKAAEEGGADRLEVVREIEREGLTPSMDLVRAIASEIRLPLRVMVRESDGFSISTPAELAALRRAMAALGGLGINGAVVGFTRQGRLDLSALRDVLAAAPDVPVTLHRAFDDVDEPLDALEAIREFPQIDRVLTDGGGGDWTARCRRLERYVARAGDRLTILAGGGVDDAALRLLASTGVVKEAHVGRAAREPAVATAPVSADRVARLKGVIASATR